MRKRIGIRLAAWAVMAAVAGSAALGAEAVEPTPVERVVPANAVALVQVSNFPALRAAFDQSALAEIIKGSQVLSYLYAVGGAAADFGAVLATGRPADEVRACLGQNVGLALLDFETPEDAKRRIPIVLLVETTDPKKLEEIVCGQLQLFSLFRSELGLAERQQAGTAVHEVTGPKGATLAFCFRDKFLIAGSRDAVNSFLDARAANQPAIATDAVYQAVRKSLASAAGITAYINMRALMQKSGANGNPEQLRRLRGVGIADAQGLGLVIDFQGRQVRERMYLHTGGHASGVLKFITEGQPITPAAAQFVPPDYTVVGSMALRDTGLWERFKTLIVDTQGEAAAGNMDVGANMVQQQFGIQIKEGFFDTLTDETFIALDLSKIGAFLGTGREPKPTDIPFIAGAKIRNANALGETLGRIAANEKLWEQGVERTAAKHGDVDIFTFKVPFNAEVRPSYSILDGTLLFSIRPQAVAAAIDAYRSKKNLAASPAVQQASAAIAGPSHYRVLVNDAQLLRALLGLIRDEVPEAGKRLVPELERALSALHGYTAALQREPEGVSLTAVSDLGTTGTFLAAAVILDQFNAVVARRVEADFDQTAMALEKYYAEHKAYPETLNQLVPNPLPALVNDRFDPKQSYGYSRGKPGPDGKFPDAWILTSVGPDKKRDIPVEQFDPPAWKTALEAQTPEGIAELKRVIYQFRKAQYEDERKNDDEGDLFRMGGKALRSTAEQPKAPAAPEVAPASPAPKPPPAAPKPSNL